MTLLVVVTPARNEQETIAALTRGVLRTADHHLIVDDGSTDETVVRALEAGAVVIPMARCLRRGLSSVYLYGFAEAFARWGVSAWYCEMDAGGSHSPDDLPAVFAGLVDADTCWGSRFYSCARYDGRWDRVALSFGGSVLARLRGMPASDATSGFIAYRGHCLQRVLNTQFRSTGHYYQTEMKLRLHTLGFRWCEVPIQYKGGRSSLRLWDVAESLYLYSTEGKESS